jgi:hypothetical protein
MASPVTIALSQLVLWYDASRIQSWPALLAKTRPEETWPTATDLGRLHATDRMTDKRHSAAEKITRNLPGLEISGKKLLLRGVGILARTGKSYTLSDEGAALTNAYREDPQGKGWVALLAGLLLRREPRTRGLVGHLSGRDAELEFDGDEWFAGSLQKARVSAPGEPDLFPFSSKAPVNLRNVLAERSWWCLGAWRSDELVGDATDCVFTGQLKPEPSVHDIGLALHSACEVLLHAGVLRSQGGGCTVDETKAAKALGPDVAEDFGWVSSPELSDSLVDVLSALLPDLRSDTGYVVASELREQLLSRGYHNPDRELAELERTGRILIYAEDYGQGRHGKGLYNDPRKQLIKLRVVAGGTQV